MDSNQEEQVDDWLNEMPSLYDDDDLDTNQETSNTEPDYDDDVMPFACFTDSDYETNFSSEPMMEKENNTDSELDEPDGTDRISDMPDNVLSKILGFMPTKNAMAAKIFSTRWGRLFPLFWTPPIVIDLDETLYERKKNRRADSQMKFEKFANRLLHETLVNFPCIDVFNLKLQTARYVDKKNFAWIGAAFRLNVREFSYHCQLVEPKLFDMLNGNTGLERLELHGASDLYFRNDFTLPNLKTLVISNNSPVTLLSENGSFSFPNLRTLVLSEVQIHCLSELTKNCIALEVLSFKQCHLSKSKESGFCLHIQYPSLKKLIIEDCYGIWECSVAIDAPNLQVLLFKGFAAESYTVQNPFNSLVSAHIGVEFSYSANGVEELVAACSSAVDLYLCAFLMDTLHLTRAQLPMFKNLKRLALGYIQRSGWAMLARLLRNSPNLEKLTFKDRFCLQDGGYSSFESLMTSIPPCLELFLKEIKFLVFDEREDEIKLVEYFAKNGKAIEMLELRCLPFKRKSTRERLAVLATQSKLVFQPRDRE